MMRRMNKGLSSIITRTSLRLCYISTITFVLVISTGCKDFTTDNTLTSAKGNTAQIWPRVIIDVITTNGNEETVHKLLDIVLELENGRILKGHVHGCPDIQNVKCDFSFFTAPNDTSAIVIVRRLPDTKHLNERRIRLPAFDYTGKNIVYITVHMSPEGSATISSPEIISPGLLSSH